MVHKNDYGKATIIGPKTFKLRAWQGSEMTIMDAGVIDREHKVRGSKYDDSAASALNLLLNKAHPRPSVLLAVCRKRYL